MVRQTFGRQMCLLIIIFQKSLIFKNDVLERKYMFLEEYLKQLFKNKKKY